MSPSGWLASLFLASAAGAAGPGEGAPPPSRFVVKAARVTVAPGKTIPRGVVVVEEGKIAAVGTDLGIPAGAHVLDYGEATICAGFVDAHSEAGADGETTDTTASYTPALRAIDAFRPNARALARAAAEGIGTIGLAPEPRNVASGIAGAVKAGRPGRVAKDAAYSLFSLDPVAFGDERYPTALATGLADLARMFRDAGTDPANAKDPDLAAMARARRDLRPWVAVRDLSALRAWLRLSQEYKLAPVVVATGDLTDAAAELAAAKVPVVLRSLTFDSPPSERRAPALYARAGCALAFVTGGPGSDLAPSALRAGAALAVASGLGRATALAAITTIPARLLGLEAAVGTIEPGRDADLVVLAGGDALDLSAGVRQVFVNGVPVEGGGSR